MTPGRNCSTMTSARFSNGSSRLHSAALFRSRAMLRLPRLRSAKLALSRPQRGAWRRISSPRPGGSILTTSAPASAKSSVANGPGSNVEKSRTNRPSSGRIARSPFGREGDIYREDQFGLEERGVCARYFPAANFTTLANLSVSSRPTLQLANPARRQLLRSGNAGELHHLAPADDLGIDETLLSVGRRAINRDRAQRNHLLPNLRQRGNRLQLGIKPLDDRARRMRGCHDHHPTHAFVAGHAGFRDGWNLGSGWNSRGR